MAASTDRTSIEEDLNEMEKKITELLETARSLNIKASLNYTKEDAAELIRTISRPFMAGQPTVEIAEMPALETIRMDAERIGQVLKNILDNSQKYSPADARPIRVSAAVEGQHLVISVQDYGIGIPQEDLGFIFEPFYRADKARSPQRDGYGLGLSLAKNVVEAHGGDITVTSQVGQGSLVRIRLPHHAGGT